jgi:hypothetical protein
VILFLPRVVHQSKQRTFSGIKRVSICIDDQPPFSFVTIFGTAKISPYRQKEILKWATKIAERYMGKSNAEAYGRRNSGEGAVFVRIKPTRILAEKDVAAFD